MDALVGDVLPPGWATARLSDLTEPPETINPAKAFEGRAEFAYVSLTSVEPGKIIAPEMIAPASAPGRARQRIRADDTLFSCVRVYLEKVVRVPEALDGEVCSTAFAVLRPRPGIDPGYLYWLTRRPAFLRAAEERQKGNSPPAIQEADLRSIEVPVAPRTEQTRIVAAINALFEEVDSGEAALARACEGLTQFRASLLHAAYSGELTADWRAARTPNEGGSDLVASIVAMRRAAGWAGTIPEASVPTPLPSGWAWSSLGELFDVFVGATPARGNAAFWGGEIPWVSSGEVAFCSIRRTRETITSAGLANSSTKLHPPGTLLLAMIGEGRTRGQAAILDIAACNNQNSAAIRVSDTPIPTRFVYHWLTFVYEETRRAGVGGNQPALNKERVRAIVLPVPPLAEMEEIVSRVDALLADATLADFAEDGSRLRQSILHAAFTGRLVPQDLADEPAAALLARLRAAPAAARRPRARRTATQPDLIETPA